MKKVAEPNTDCGVIVGRFQVHELHAAHTDLIQTVCNEHSKVIIFLGLSPLMVTQNNPLDFESRKQMILEKFPNVIVMYIKDINSDELWSKELDEKIKDLVSPTQSVILYGSRDSFIKHYSGKYKTQELMQEVYVSGSELRKNISKRVKASADFRAGVIWASGNRYPTCLATVDIAIFNENYTKLLLARKPKEELYRLVGGFSDPKCDSYEEDAMREVQEETGLEIGDLVYIGSKRISDFRYQNEIDKIKTMLYSAKVIFGTPVAQDDIAELKWYDIKKLNVEKDIVEEHKALIELVLNWLENKEK